MGTQERRAGPGRDRRSDRLVGMEAAGPASPRLLMEEVRFGVSHDSVEVAVTLSRGSLRFTGIRADKGGSQPTWQLAAAATVDSIQQHLQHSTTAQPAPQVQLLDIATAITGTGQEVILAAIRLVDDSRQTNLLGSSLVRNDRCSTAVAAALDAVNRRLVRFIPPVTGPPPSAVAPRTEERAPSEPAPALRRERIQLPVEASPARPVAPPDEPPVEPMESIVPVLTEEAESGSNGSDKPSVVLPEIDLSLEGSDGEPGPNGADKAETEESETEAGFEVLTFPTLLRADLALAVEISPTSVRAVAVEAEGRVLAEERRPSRATSESEQTLEAAIEAARAVVAALNSSADRLAAIGVTMPGRLRPSDGVCVSCGDFPAWREVSLAAPFSAAFDLPVSLIGTTQAAALAETRFGSAQGLSNLLFVRIGIDIDIAVISNGRPLMLNEASPGQVGHMVVAPGGPRCSCGEIGCWQAVAGREALVARAVHDIGSGVPSALSAAAGNRPGAVTPALICQIAASGDGVARNALEETGRYLALGLANLVTLFDPEAVIIDAMPAAVGVALRHAAEVALKASPRSHILSRCVLLAPALGDMGPALGAAAWAVQNHSRKPRVVA